jgi:phasin family protein
MATTTRNTNAKADAADVKDNVNEATEATKQAGDKAVKAGNDIANEATEATRQVGDKAVEASRNATNAAQGAARETAARSEAFVNDTKKTVSEQLEKFSRGFEGLTQFNQENLDAIVKSSETVAKAAESIGSELSAYSKKAFEDGVAAAQDLASARTVTELFEKQTAYAQTAIEGWVHQATKMNEIYIAAAKDISAPLGRRVTAATEAFRGFNA